MRYGTSIARPWWPVAWLLLGLASTLRAQQADRLPPRLDDATFAARTAHWAWRWGPAVAPPAAGHPVDAFLDAARAERGLSRAPAAPPAVQLRRLHLDLVGLPPAPEVTAAFVADPSDAAWAAQVDTLLASLAHAERFARHWLDLVRYAETLGHEFDFPLPNAHHYRDYVIRAFAADVPHDQFLREHLAGDLLPTPRRGDDGSNESVLATASFWFGEQVHAPVDAPQHEADRIDNQLDVLGKAMLGLTVACARCHDHKFDAIRANDYFALFGYLRSSRYVQAPLRPVDVGAAPYQQALAAQREVGSQWLAAQAAVAPSTAADQGAAVAAAAAGDGGVATRPEDIVVAHAGGPRAAWWSTNDGFGAEPWRGLFCLHPEAAMPRLHLLPGPFWLSAAAGRQREGVLQTATFPLTERYLHLRAAGQQARLVVVVDGFYLVRDPIYGSLRQRVDDPSPHWHTFDLAAFAGRPAFVQGLDQRAPDLADPDREQGEHPADSWLAVQQVLLSPHGSPPESAPGPRLEPLPGIAAPPALAEALAALAAATAALPVGPTVPSLGDGTGVDAAVHLRGNPHQPGPVVPRRFLAALSPPAPTAAGPGSGRLELATAVLAPDNPLPARVFVNRAWHWLFGRGLVRSVDNLGTLGDAPTHPALLDWLARDFVAHGWSRRHLLRLLVTSAAYRQSSAERPEAARLDPGNQWWHRQEVRRLEAEALRDSLLAVSGRLDPTPFGPPVSLPLDGVPDQRGRPRHSGPIDGDGRRSIYLAVRRNIRLPFFAAFDQPHPFATVGARAVSNVPAQVLTLANDPFVHQTSRHFAARVLAAAATGPARLDLAYLLAFSRPPRPDERDAAVAFLQQHDGADETERWADLLHALLATTEFRYRR